MDAEEIEFLKSLQQLGQGQGDVSVDDAAESMRLDDANGILTTLLEKGFIDGYGNALSISLTDPGKSALSAAETPPEPPQQQ
jgi:hypothetical protein